MWRDDAYLLDMLIYARKARDFAARTSYEELDADEIRQAALERVLSVIGEAASKVSLARRESHPDIAWHPIISLRHRLVHDYPRIELPKIWNIIQNHIPPLIETLERLTPPEEPEP